jgi:hypothetical protein
VVYHGQGSSLSSKNGRRARGPVERKTQNFAVHAGGGAGNGGKKRNVLTVSVLLPRALGYSSCAPLQ